MSDFAPWYHAYISTGCLHGKHEECRLTCKYHELEGWECTNCLCSDCTHEVAAGPVEARVAAERDELAAEVERLKGGLTASQQAGMNAAVGLMLTSQLVEELKAEREAVLALCEEADASLNAMEWDSVSADAIRAIYAGEVDRA